MEMKPKEYRETPLFALYPTSLQAWAYSTVRKVIYNPPATIILWMNGSKTVVKCREDDIYDPMIGFLLCCLKHYLGADNDPAKFHRFLKEYGPKPEEMTAEVPEIRVSDTLQAAAESASKAMNRLSKIFARKAVTLEQLAEESEE